MNDLVDNLPRLLPLAIAWVQAQEAVIATTGRTLTAIESRLAVAVGVQHPDRVRIKLVMQMPEADRPELRAIAKQTNLIGPHTGGITFGHGIYSRRPQLKPARFAGAASRASVVANIAGL